MNYPEPEPLIFEHSRPGRVAVPLPESDAGAPGLDECIPASMLREEPADLPEVGQLDLVRHFVRLSQMNMSVDTHFYPLGSCTMKYNPKVNDWASELPGMARIHPYQPDETLQGALALLHSLENALAAVSGFDAISLQPAAGAHGEFLGLLLIRSYHKHHEPDGERLEILIPDSAHGTNPASAALCGFKSVQVNSDEFGFVDLEDLCSKLGPQTAGMMITNPNTLGLFDQNIVRAAAMIHEAGGLLYMDGANFNAIVGQCLPAEFGIDVMHFNLHKTFSTPHGGGGPGSGPVGVVSRLEPFLPVPRVVEEDGVYRLDSDLPLSVGRVRSFMGNFGILVRAYTYIMMHGPEGIRRISENAVLNANYIMAKLKDAYDLPYDVPCMHECVFSADRQKKGGVRALEIAKKLLDLGFHAPTIYFPLIVHEALMIEPTETESKETLDSFIDAMLQIAQEVEENPAAFENLPQSMPVGRLDEVKAARELQLCWRA
ncbi:MAG: aminomethyl-transferring glycine dehydrogenase subunit GcvPB [Planctomycetota bacterium]|jgi:glycine dehydrogenase subunit 2|nr:aminomethyl-transferring glycine dehydrogenase subunit GcvPB [Planctomycetota bacterium]MDP7130812.1 aminomethyl-transferring glycine dehydrogenase subunit GcvPB [Planctomycetota bacterium]MDP7249227.1 aminomethyl-transferring glycine dehydrogenase subunit GcvPB [Planctomycetota bacterium]